MQQVHGCLVSLLPCHISGTPSSRTSINQPSHPFIRSMIRVPLPLLVKCAQQHVALVSRIQKRPRRDDLLPLVHPTNKQDANDHYEQKIHEVSLLYGIERTSTRANPLAVSRSPTADFSCTRRCVAYQHLMKQRLHRLLKNGSSWKLWRHSTEQ